MEPQSGEEQKKPSQFDLDSIPENIHPSLPYHLSPIVTDAQSKFALCSLPYQESNKARMKRY